MRLCAGKLVFAEWEFNSCHKLISAMHGKAGQLDVRTDSPETFFACVRAELGMQALTTVLTWMSSDWDDLIDTIRQQAKLRGGTNGCMCVSLSALQQQKPDNQGTVLSLFGLLCFVQARRSDVWLLVPTMLCATACARIGMWQCH